jgi:hypothetical protein
MNIEKEKVYKHVKSGAEYIVTDIGYLESDRELMVVYRRYPVVNDGYPWIRPYNEFQDKFKPI